MRLGSSDFNPKKGHFAQMGLDQDSLLGQEEAVAPCVAPQPVFPWETAKP